MSVHSHAKEKLEVYFHAILLHNVTTKFGSLS